MSEEEIIDIIENEILDFVIGDYCLEICKEDESGPCEDYECRYTQAINGLLDLYKQEKEKHKATIYNFELVVDKLENSISKDKIRDKIKELEEDKKGYEEEGFENMKFATEITIIALEELLGDDE